MSIRCVGMLALVAAAGALPTGVAHAQLTMEPIGATLRYEVALPGGV